MRKSLLLILSITALACFLISIQPINAAVYNQFGNVTTRNWGGDFKLPTELQNNFVVFNDGHMVGSTPTPNDFRLYPNPATRPDNNLDDGYAVVDLGFTYRYNNVDYTNIYVSINGFVTFNVPPGSQEVTRDPNGLFLHDEGGSIPNNVVAPYWGDHRYWQNTQDNIAKGFAPSEIGYVKYTYEVYDPYTDANVTRNAILIQWKNMNINWMDRVLNQGGGYDTTFYKGNVASFQLIIYQGTNDTYSLQGDMEFRYGNYGPTITQKEDAAPGTLITYNPDNEGAVGFKGDTKINSNQSDYVNCVYNGFDYINYPADEFFQRNYPTLATYWPASGDVARAILLGASHSVNGDDTWGDGDADMSKAEGGRHQSSAAYQNIFVTLNDVRTIMSSVVTHQPLDSVYRRDAFHADVHHDGRYYYLTNRNAGIYRMIQETGTIEAVGKYNQYCDSMDAPQYFEWVDSISLGDVDGDGIEDFELIPLGVTEYHYSQDTFYLRKVGDYQGRFGFKPMYGENDEYIVIDFIDMPGNMVTVSNSKRIFKIIAPGNENAPDGDYQIRIVLVDDGDAAKLAFDRQLLKSAAYPEVNTNINMIRVNLKKNVIWRDTLISQRINDLPWISSPETQLFWQADEKDASLILMYLGGKLPWLPWYHEDIDFQDKGKVTVPYTNATNIAFDNARVENGKIVVPVYFNGNAEDAQSSSFKLNTEVVDFESANANVLVDFRNDTRTFVIVSDGKFNPHIPIAYITLEDNNVNEIVASMVKFDGKYTDNVRLKLNSGNNNGDAYYLSQNVPNPVTNSTSFNVTIPEANNYRIAIYNMNGSLVKVVAEGWMEATTANYTWDAKDISGADVTAGAYIYRLESDKLSVSKRLTVVR